MFEIEGVSTTVWIILGLVNIPLYYVILRFLWNDWTEFFQALFFWFTPDVISMFRGRWSEDVWQSCKLIFWLAVCFSCVYGEAKIVGSIFP